MNEKWLEAKSKENFVIYFRSELQQIEHGYRFSKCTRKKALELGIIKCARGRIYEITPYTRNVLNDIWRVKK